MGVLNHIASCTKVMVTHQFMSLFYRTISLASEP